MLFIGLLIALAAAAFAGVVLAEDWGGAAHTIHGFGTVLGHLTLAGIFLSGIILTTIFFLALWLASISSMTRRRASDRRRAERRALRDEHESALADRDRLARELEAERAAHGADHQALKDRDAAWSDRDAPTTTRVVELPPDSDAHRVAQDPEPYPRHGSYEPGTDAGYRGGRSTADDEARRHTV